MNKIQLEAGLQLAQMDFDANPNQLNEQKLKQAQQAWDQFIAPEAEEKQPEAPKKAAAKAEPKQAEAPKKAAAKAEPKQAEAKKAEAVTPKVENPGTIGETAVSADRDASAEKSNTAPIAENGGTEALEVAEPVDEASEKKTE